MKRKLLFILTSLFLCFGSYSQVKFHANNLTYQINEDSAGVSVHTFDFNAKTLYPKHEWEGKWIWLNKDKFPDYQYTNSNWIKNKEGNNKHYRALYRKKVHLDSLSNSAILFTSGDVLFNLYINDSLVCHGPVNIGGDYFDKNPPAYWYYSSCDIEKYLKKGDNIIVAEVFSWAFELSEVTSTHGRFLCDVSLDGEKPTIFTDQSWKCSVDTSFNYKNGRLIFNANNESGGWKELRYDDRQWSNASEKESVKPGLLFQNNMPDPIRYYFNPQNINILSQNKKQEVSSANLFNQIDGEKEFILDFGKNMPAYISFSLMANAYDSLVVIPYEKSDNKPNRSFLYICRQGLNSYITPNLTVFRYLKVKVYAKTSLAINSFRADYSSYPVQYKGTFSCSDDFYNKLWNITRWTTQMCMNDMFYDSPMHQEPIACTGDYFIESLSNYYAFGDPWLVRQNLIQTAQMLEKNDYKMFHTSYSLIWIQMLNQYFQYTGDTLLVQQLMPHIDKLLLRFSTYLDQNYLLSKAPNYMFMDWIKINDFNAHHPPAVIGMGYLTALYYKALNDAATLCKITGSCNKSQTYLSLAEKVKDGINKKLWDANKGLFKDGIPFITTIKPNDWLPADKDIVTYSPHINTLAVLYDIAPKDIQSPLMKYVVDQKEYELQPYFMSFVLAAMKHVGKIDEGLQLIDLWRNAIDTTTYTLKENWNDVTAFGYGGDYSHAWGGSPLYFLSQNILGISPLLAGYKTIKITPCLSNKISWAKGVVPIGNNSIATVSWERKSKATFSYTVSIPQNYKAILYHPLPLRKSKININGKNIQFSKKMILSSGNYVINYSE